MLNKKNLPYIAIITIIIIVAAYIFYTQFAPLPHLSNATANIFDGQPLNNSIYSGLYGVANNQTLANNISTAFASNNGYSKINGTPLALNGKPEILYIGAEYCPYCAVTRWALAIALMRFGSFSGLHYMTSSAADVFPNTATLTFYNSTYASSYISFIPVETATNKPDPAINFYYPLQSLNSSESTTLSNYDKGSSIPFIDFGNSSLQVGSAINPQMIGGDNWSTIVGILGNPNSQITEEILGTANLYTAAICEKTGNLPASVCSQKYVKSIEEYG